MIRINLLPHKKKSSTTVSVEGDKIIAAGMAVIMALVAGIFLFIDGPMKDEIATQQGKNSKLSNDAKKINERTKNFTDLKAAFTAAKAQAAAIASLNSARATPANFLQELSTILSPGGRPTMTQDMVSSVAHNENLSWDEDWNPQHIWVNSISETGGHFVLTGAAQSDGDVTQFAHRLTASAYFVGVQPEGMRKIRAQSGGITTYDFTITGQVRY